MKIKSVVFLPCLLNLPTLLHGFNSKLPNFRPTTKIGIYGSSLTTHFRQYEQSTSKTPQSIRLFSSLEEDGSRKKKPRKNRRRARMMILAFRKVFVNLVSTPGRMIVRFRSLSKKGKVLMAMQTLTVMLLFGSIGRNVYARNYQMKNGLRASGPPVEVPYSNFLELVENSGSTTKKGLASPTVDNMRISQERIVYRLTQESSDSTGDGPSIKQLACYTNKIAASPELIETLHTHKVPFTAANRQRANNLAIAARTAILDFIC